jgi:hypothetical protein
LSVETSQQEEVKSITNKSRSHSKQQTVKRHLPPHKFKQQQQQQPQQQQQQYRPAVILRKKIFKEDLLTFSA